MDKNFIKTKVGSNPRWACRALVALYDRQTREEQGALATIEHNGMGFNGVDAEILSSFAQQIIRGRRLSARQMSIAYRKLPKYAGQLLEIAERKDS